MPPALRIVRRAERRQVQRLLRRPGRGPRGSPPDPSVPVGRDTLPQIRHVVVLMMENHSYDNYLGALDGRGEGFPRDADGNPTATNEAMDEMTVPARHRRTTTQVKGVPLQTWYGSHLQWGGGKCDGFVRSIEEWDPKADRTVPMDYWTETDLPFSTTAWPAPSRWQTGGSPRVSDRPSRIDGS
jgi:phospholipase C